MSFLLLITPVISFSVGYLYARYVGNTTVSDIDENYSNLKNLNNLESSKSIIVDKKFNSPLENKSNLEESFKIDRDSRKRLFQEIKNPHNLKKVKITEKIKEEDIMIKNLKEKLISIRNNIKDSVILENFE